MRKRISQRNARYFRDEMNRLRQQMRDFTLQSANSNWPGVHLGTVPSDRVSTGVGANIRTARKLRHAVVAVVDSATDKIDFYAVEV